MGKSFDWKKELTERERFIGWTSLMVGVVTGAIIVIIINYGLWLFEVV